MRAVITVDGMGESEYRVTVHDGGSSSVYEVSVSPGDVARYAPGVRPERLVRASFEFLFARRSQDAIPRAFDLSALEQQFPEYAVVMSTWF